MGGVFIKRLFMLSRHSRQYTSSSVPNPSLGPGAPNILIHSCVNICSIIAFFICGFFVDSFKSFEYLINKLMIRTRGLVFMPPV